MRTHTFTTILLGALLLTGCTKEDQKELAVEAELLLQYNSIELTVDPGTYNGQLELTLNFSGQELSDLMSSNGYTMDQLQEFNFTKADLHIMTPDQENFDLVDMAEMMLSATGLDTRSIAAINPVPEGVRDLSLTLSDVNVADLLRSPDVSLNMVTEMHGTLADTVRVRVDLGGRVVVEL